MADFLDEAFPVENQVLPDEPPAVADAQPAPEAPPVVPETPQEPEQPAPTPQTEAQTPAQPPQDHTVPLAKYLDTRDEAKELKRRLAAYEARPQADNRPDPLDDPDGYGAHLERQMEERVTTLRFQMSEAMAKQVHGEDAVNSASAWASEKAQADPAFALAYMRDPNPIDWIVRQHKREEEFSQLGGKSLQDYVREEIARQGYVLPSASAVAAPVSTVAAVTQPAGRPPAPPRSIAADAPANAVVPGDPRAEFLAIFDRK